MKPIKLYILILLLVFGMAAQAQNIPDPSNLGPATGLGTPATIADLKPGLILNYTKNTSPVTPVKTDLELNAVKEDCAKSALQTICTDGLGRPLQTIVRKPFNAADKKDIVQHHIYDAFGREVRNLLPFAKAETDPARNGKFNPFIWTNLRSTYTELGYSDEQFLYSENDLEASPLSRLKATRAEGNNWVGKGISRSITSELNTSTVFRWKMDFTGTLPVLIGNYTEGTLTVNTVTDEEGNTISTYTDMEGKVILKDDKGIQQLYVYDELNRLRFEIPQKAITAIAANGQVISQQIADNLCTRHEYDEDGRQIVLKKPGIGETYFVYDKYDQVILTQDPLKKVQGKWIFNKYDPSGRLIQSGLMNAEFLAEYDPTKPPATPSNVIYTRAMLQDLVSFSSLTDPFLQYLYNRRIYKHSQYRDVFSNAAIFVSYYFDSYDFSPPPFVTTTNYGAYDVANSNKVKGLLTGTKALLSDSSGSVTTCNFYNSRSELIQVQRSNPDGSLAVTTMGYDFKGRMISSQMAHGAYTIIKKYQYDVLDRLMYVHHRINNAASFTKIAQYNYDQLGRVSVKILGNMSHPINYEYNIRGWITGINKAYCDDKTRGFYFGMAIYYDKGYNTTYLDGKIAGIQWRNKGTSDELRSYGYMYDQGRMVEAEYQQKDQGTLNPSDWSKGVKDFTTTVSYDPNGNITAMKHMGINNVKRIIALDDLHYTYHANSNTIKQIADKTNDQEARDAEQHNGYGDFRKNLSSSASQDYTYDANGNISHDENRSLGTITNDWFTIGKPTYIETFKGDQVTYLYDALGNLLQKKTLQSGAGPSVENTYDYIGDIIYKNGTAQMIMHDEGRVRVESGLAGNTYIYDYFLKDHLDNVRSIITEDAGAASGTMQPPAEPGYTITPDPSGVPLEAGGMMPTKDPLIYLATCEPVNNDFETSVFENIESTRALRPIGSTPENKYCAKLIGTDNAPGMGPSIILKVSADDQIQIGVQTYFFNNIIPGSALPLQSLATGLVGLITGGAAISPEGIALTQQGLPISLSQAGSALTQIREGQQDTTKPMAHLNYMMFDSKMQFLPEASGAVQVSLAATWKNIDLPKITVPENGFIYIFTSNQTPANVYMDNLYVTTWSGRLIEETHYYPYGLSFDTYKAPGNKVNDVKYNSQYLEQNEYEDANGDKYGLDWYDFAARSYDPQIGRWMQPDPMMQHASPYLAMSNNPAIFTDPSGLWDGRNAKEGELRTGEDGTRYAFQKGVWGFADDIEVLAGWSGNGQIQRGAPTPQTDWEKRNWNTYNDPTNGQSHKSFDASEVNSKSSMNAKGSGTPWMDHAFMEKGQREQNPGNNPRIIMYLNSAGNKSKNDETPWCAAFAHWSMSKANIKGAGPTGNNWSTWGRGLDKPAYGAIAVFRTGHVGFVAGEKSNGSLVILHGNWSNAVSLSTYGISRSDIRLYRFPTTFEPSYILPKYK
ncbi:MAG: TIGR02594 family protein [Candidatus Pedobacter colombiensis]|uniref:TIGR02594 family protein n=1 Tax=Candidatus Pedobacter colombiensis TaxID=3121371 RepID=A0AAJ5W684_9SPHI|nr:TIGR02594 family protein [Pedobacter sp.]WEK18861.1 MAG: TIGR02594 family protein [Pedobacter sp.]